MAATQDIVATYRRPGTVMRRLLGQGKREDRALIFLMVGCLMVFVGSMPKVARRAFETGSDVRVDLVDVLMPSIFILPLFMYGIAGLIYLVIRVVGSGVSAYGVRLVLFWSFLATSPLALLRGLTAGFVGPGIEVELVKVAWFGFFLWFVIAGFRTAAQEAV